ncbi:hypothetical protein AAFF_G00032130 [Aldrovandia affinis]|uniref:DUF4685 domain-containing protein n=1 Tax=Aldrovandia affinis TaxID=143900 RepID=A0AAD7S3V4_9TELE|nr:hypothetical protein AAFF_G00032130 [Aldrovandia affinis]
MASQQRKLSAAVPVLCRTTATHLSGQEKAVIYFTEENILLRIPDGFPETGSRRAQTRNSEASQSDLRWRGRATLPDRAMEEAPVAGGSDPLTGQHSLPGSAVSALQSKVKALSERRAAWRERGSRGPASLGAPQSPAVLVTGSGPPQVIKRASASALVPLTAGNWLSSSSDEEAEPQVQVHTYLPNYPLPGDPEAQGEGVGGPGYEAGPIGALPFLSRGLGEGASVENLSDVSGGIPDEPPKSAQPCWAPPKGFWRATRPEMLLLNGDAPLAGEGGGTAAVAPPQGKAWTVGGPGGRRELQRSDSLESQLHRCAQSETAPPPGGLWRADSWESVCSGGSSLSLAERVELNRGILKQMLSKPLIRDLQGPPGSGHRAGDLAEGSDRGSTVQNDSDWDSGISVQDSEHSHSQRAFVLGDDLPLSPRHEQAKRLLDRARMKARAYPLKADHTILPVQRENPEPHCRVGVSLHQAPLVGKEGVLSACGNQSDSSSGDSACAPRRRHGQSPTSVRFEDESETDAEVRYLERLRQRRRAGERALGLLVSKPNLSSYVNGRKEGDIAPGRRSNASPRGTAGPGGARRGAL